MEMVHYEAKEKGQLGEVFSHLPLDSDADGETGKQAADGVSCSVCHQIGNQKLGHPRELQRGLCH